MVVVVKYPTSSGANPDVWISPNNALGVADGLCASKNAVASGSWYLYLSGYGFAIPAGSTINHVYINHKGIIACAINGDLLNFSFIHEAQLINDFSSDTIVGAPCGSTAYKSDYDILPDLAGGRTISVDDLNNEVFTTQLHATALFAIPQVFRCDSCYIEVDYTPPSALASKRLLVGVGT